MISVSVGFRETRAKDQERPGVVFFRIYGPDAAGGRSRVSVNTPVTGSDKSCIESNRHEILALIRLLYDVVLDCVRQGTATVGDVAESFRAAVNDTERKVTEADLQSPMRADLFAVGSGFHKYVRMVYPQPDETESGFGDLLSFIAYKSQACRADNRVSTSRSYAALGKELSDYSGKDVIGWDEVDSALIKGFADWLIDQGFKESTQGYYLGMLRTLLFQAAEQGYCEASSEWFKPVTTRALPKADGAERKKMDVDVIRRLKNLNLQGNENLSFVRDLFMFAFYCRGMELVDVAHLTRGNLHGNMLIYNKRLTGKEIRIPIEREARLILERYATGNRYLFPLLEFGRSNLFATRRTWVNNHLKVIGELIGVKGLSFVNNIEAWTTMFSSMHITERFLSASS